MKLQDLSAGEEYIIKKQALFRAPKPQKSSRMRSLSIVESGGMAQAENRDWLNVDMKSLYSNPSPTPGRDEVFYREK